MKFRIGVKEVHTQWVTVEAENVEDAIRKVEDGQGNDDLHTEFDHTLPSHVWKTEVIEDAPKIEEIKRIK